MQHIDLSPEERSSIAKRVGKSPRYIYQIITGRRKASAALARRIHEADARLRLQDLRPDDWHVIWPELNEREARP